MAGSLRDWLLNDSENTAGTTLQPVVADAVVCKCWLSHQIRRDIKWRSPPDDDPTFSRKDTTAFFQGRIRGLKDRILAAHKTNINKVMTGRGSCQSACISKMYTNYVTCCTTRATGWGWGGGTHCSVTARSTAAAQIKRPDAM
jgi:hypothetical protein